MLHWKATLVTVLPANGPTCCMPISEEVVRLLSTTEKVSAVLVWLVTARMMVALVLDRTRVGVRPVTATS